MSKIWVPDLGYKHQELALTEDSPAFSQSDNRVAFNDARSGAFPELASRLTLFSWRDTMGGITSGFRKMKTVIDGLE